MKIYLSIPISGLNEETQRAHAEREAKKLERYGYIVVNPFNTPAPPDYYNEKRKYAHYMGEDIKKLLTCEAIYMCKGWEKSTGCRIERAIADIMYIPTYYEK